MMPRSPSPKWTHLAIIQEDANILEFSFQILKSEEEDTLILPGVR